MTPAIKLLKNKKIKHTVHQYKHDEMEVSYGQEAANKMGVDSNKIFKTLIISLGDKTLAVAIIPVKNTLNMKKVAKVMQSKKVTMAAVDEVLRSTGYILGGVSPLAQKKKLTTVIDESAQTFESIYVSAGQRGLEVELSPRALVELTQASVDAICN